MPVAVVSPLMINVRSMPDGIRMTDCEYEEEKERRMMEIVNKIC
jgi:hypothetical protein